MNYTNIEANDKSVDRKVILSGLWLFINLNILFRDVHELIMARAIKEILSGKLNGTVVTEELMLFGAFVVEILIAMTFLSRVLPRATNRWLNIVIAPVVLAGIITTSPNDMDDIFFQFVQAIAVCAIFVLAITWSRNSA